jgi:hypothetical protein
MKIFDKETPCNNKFLIKKLKTSRGSYDVAIAKWMHDLECNVYGSEWYEKNNLQLWKKKKFAPNIDQLSSQLTMFHKFVQILCQIWFL